MYVVISKWEFDPSKESEVRERANKMRTLLRSWPEVEFSYNVKAGDNYALVVIGYSDKAAYERLIQDPEGPFEKAAKEAAIEQYATWVWSERGEQEE